MDQKNSLVPVVIFAVVFAAVLLVGAYILPWGTVLWGKLEVVPAATVSVNGEAETQQKSQVASYSAGVSAISDNKDAAVAEVNQKVQAIIDAVKTFGIASEDIKTQNLSLYQQEEQYYEDGRQKTRQGQWRVNNSVEIKLREVDKASALADLLAKTGANNVYGPNFTLDDTKDAEAQLVDAAIKNAQAKAESIAQSSGRKLGKIISVSEAGIQQAPMYRAFEQGGGGGAPIEPGTGTVTKTVTVVFELK